MESTHHISAESLLRDAVAASLEGQMPEAISLFREYVRLHPGDSSAYFNLAKALREAGQLPEAAATYRQAAQLNPHDPDIWYNLGNVLRGLDDLTEAAEAYKKVIAIDPGYANAHNNLGLVYADIGREEEALAAYRNACAADPGLLDARMNLSTAFLHTGSVDEAERICRDAIAADPHNSTAYYNLGGVLRERSDFAGAVDAYTKALSFRPEYAEAYNNRGVCHLWSGEPDAAMKDFDACLMRMPDFPDAHYNRAFVLLLTGDYVRGWPEYEWRFETTDRVNPVPNFPFPRWHGEQLHGETVLVSTEQGFGDAIQFVRFMAPLAEEGATVILRCQKELLPLFRTVRGLKDVVSIDDPVPPCDLHTPIMSLPGLLGVTLDKIPATIPYVSPHPSSVERWKPMVKRDGAVLLVGCSIAGNQSNKYLRTRSCPADVIKVLGEVSGAKFVSLEKKSVISEGMQTFDDQLTDFGETAALIHYLDLVITVDTAVAHLAGAMGKAAWLMLPAVADWRWLRDRSTTPWYPTMRIFRQREPGNWTELIERVRQALALFVHQQEAASANTTDHHRVVLSGASLERFRDFVDWIGGMTYPESPMQMHASITARMLPQVIERCGLKPESRILDVGCGQGPALDILRESGFSPVGIGINDEDLAICRSKGHTVFAMDQSFLDFPEESFDLIWARHCVEHSFAPLLTLRGFHRVMAKGGWLYLEVPGPDTACHHESNPNHYSVLHQSLWDHLLQKAGLTVEVQNVIEFGTVSGPDRYLVFLARKP